MEAPIGVGELIDLTFDGPFNPDMEITALEPNSLVEWRCVAGHDPWAGSSFRFVLSEGDRGTRLRFWQRYARELDDDSYGVYNFNWGYYLDSLRLLCETGAGKPFQVASS